MTTKPMEAESLGGCPFCPGAISVTREPMAVMHTLPTCAKYEQKDPMVFLRDARMAKVGPLPDDDEWPLPSNGEGQPS